jgi:uncharacterized protein YmfQ (DUF2313 family)
MELMRRFVASLLPSGSPWQVEQTWAVLVAGWAANLTHAKEWVNEVKNHIYPSTATSRIDDWYWRLGIAKNSELSLEQQQAQLEAIDTAGGGQDVVYINTQLQVVYPNVWVERVEINNRLGNRRARCGVATCQNSRLLDANGIATSSVYFYYVKGAAYPEEQQGLADMLARLCPAHLQAIYLVMTVEHEVQYAR